MILISGAAGKTGRSVIEALTRRGVGIRAMLRREEQRSLVEPFGVRETVVGDMLDVDSWLQATLGCSAIYHICPNMHRYEREIGQLAIKAAIQAGADHFVYHSVLHPQTESMPHHWQKLRVEEELLKSGLRFTIVQPAAYMQNLLAYWPSICERGLLPVPYAAHTLLSMVDLKDVAEVAALTLTEPGHAGATYQLVGSDALSQQQLVGILSQVLHRPVSVDSVDRAEWADRARASGLGEYQVESLLAMFEYYEQYGLCGNPGVLRWLLGRESTSLASFLTRTVAEHDAVTG